MSFKKIVLVLLLSFAGAECISAQEIPDGMVRHSMKDQGIEREYLLYIPETMTDGAPLVIDMHGYGGSMYRHRSGLLEIAKKEGFALCVPQAAVDPNGKHGWIVGYPFQEGAEIDDVKFVKRLAKKLQKEYSLNPKNTFATGSSNGGEMCYILAFVASDVFRAFASNAGLMMDWAYRRYEAPRPVPFMEVHGTADKTSKWNGDPGPDDIWGKYISVPAAVGYWIARNRCNTEITEYPEQASGAKHEVILHRYVNGTDNCEVRLYEVVGAGHGYHTKDFDEARAIWDFFKLYISE